SLSTPRLRASAESDRIPRESTTYTQPAGIFKPERKRRPSRPTFSGGEKDHPFKAAGATLPQASMIVVFQQKTNPEHHKLPRFSQIVSIHMDGYRPQARSRWRFRLLTGCPDPR